MPGDRLRNVLETFGRVEAVGESFQVFKLGDIDVSLPRRESTSGRARTQRVRRRRRSRHVHRGGRLGAARFHDQRHLGIRLTPARTSIRSTAARPRAALLADGRRPHIPGRQPAGAARGPVRGALRSRARPRTRALCRTIQLDDLPAERIWGEIEKLLFAPRPSVGFALADLISARLPRSFRNCRRSPVVESRSGIPKATFGCTRSRWSIARARASTTCPARSSLPSCWARSLTIWKRRRRRSATDAFDRFITRTAGRCAGVGVAGSAQRELD